MNASVIKLQQFFFEAAAVTYASGEKAKPLPELAGAKHYWYQPAGSPLCYADVFFVNGESSGGQTVIYEHAKPVWIMQYHGWCKDDDPEVLTFLKKALLRAYLDKKFYGGRGEPGFAEIGKQDGLIYDNFAAPPHHGFTDFQGRERIWCKGRRDTELFWHRYQGLLLAK